MSVRFLFWMKFGDTQFGYSIRVLIFRTMFGIKFGEISAFNPMSSAFSFMFNFLIFVMTDECGEEGKRERGASGILDEYLDEHLDGLPVKSPRVVTREREKMRISDDHDGRFG